MPDPIAEPDPIAAALDILRAAPDDEAAVEAVEAVADVAVANLKPTFEAGGITYRLHIDLVMADRLADELGIEVGGVLDGSLPLQLQRDRRSFAGMIWMLAGDQVRETGKTEAEFLRDLTPPDDVDRETMDRACAACIAAAMLFYPAAVRRTAAMMWMLSARTQLTKQIAAGTIALQSIAIIDKQLQTEAKRAAVAARVERNQRDSLRQTSEPPLGSGPGLSGSTRSD